MDFNDNSSNDNSLKANSPNTPFEKNILSTQGAGVDVVYTGLLLHYMLKKVEVPTCLKMDIAISLNYFRKPIYCISKKTEKYLDPFQHLVPTLEKASLFVDAEIIEKADSKLEAWLDGYDRRDLANVLTILNHGLLSQLSQLSKNHKRNI